MPQLSDYNSTDYLPLLGRIEAAVYEDVSPLRTSAWLTDEPVPFVDRQTGHHRDLRPGSAWGEKVFDCAWFLFEGEAPPASEKTTVLLIDVNGELCLYDEAGTALAGLTSVASSFDFRLGKPGKRVFRPPVAFAPGQTIRLWGDGGYNDLFGMLSGDGRLVEARVVRCDEEVRRLYYDVAFLIDYRRALTAEAALARRIKATLDAVSGVWQPERPETTRQALEITARFFAMRPGEGLLKVTAAGHAHLDLAWLWPLRESRRKTVRTLATALGLAERYPYYRMAASQAQMFAWVKEQDPALFERVVQAVRRGVIEPVGDAWVEPDTNVPGGESLIRQLSEGRAFFSREFGTRSEVMFLPDVFGYSAALPQIMLGCGLKYFMTQKLSWNTVNKFPHQSFWWEGLDGSRVLSHMLPEETYNSPASASALFKLENNYRDIGVCGQALMLFGIGDGGGGPGEEHLENLERARNTFGLPNVSTGRVADFFEAIVPASGSFPTWRGELYLERHQGTLTTQADMKRCHRQAEILLREVEWLLASEQALGADTPPEDLGPIWREELLFQFHDILPGSSIRRVYVEALPAYETLLAKLDDLRAAVSQRLAARLSPAGTARGAAVVNSLPWARQEWVRDATGWRWCGVPGSTVTVSASTSGGEPSRPRVEGFRLSNDLVECTVGPRGGLVSLRMSGAGGREFAARGEELGLLRIYQDHGDAWDTPLDYQRLPSAVPKVVGIKEFCDGPDAGYEIELRCGASRIFQRISLRAGSPLVSFDLDMDWQTPNRLVRAVFPCDVPAARATYEIQFGWLERPNHENTSWDAARHECPHQQWVDLSNSRCGLAVINAGKYGSVIKDQTIEMSLLRSVPYPGYDGQGGGSVADANAKISGLGRHWCRYAVMPHGGNAAEAGVWRQARAFNQPLQTIDVEHDGNPASRTLFDLDGDGFDVTAFKPAATGEGVVLRLVRFADSRVDVRLRIHFPVREAWETTMLEEPLRQLSTDSGTFSLSFRPFEVKTVWLR